MDASIPFATLKNSEKVKNVQNIICRAAAIAVFAFLMSGAAFAGGHGTNHAHAPHTVQRHTPSTHHVAHPVHHSNNILSNTAYWKAANSPTPPLPGRNANLYTQKLQVWQLYHPTTSR